MRFRTRKAAALLACLAFRLGQAPPTRDALTEILWPNSDPESALARLAVELAALRRQLEPPGILRGSILRADRYTISLDPDNVTTDVLAFETLLRRAQTLAKSPDQAALLGEAARQYGGILLPQIEGDWIEPERERLTTRFMAAAVEAVESLLSNGAVREASEIALLATQRERLHETSHVLRMRCEIAASRPEEALRRFDEWTRLVREAIDQSPGAEARRIASEARRLADSATNPPASSMPSPRKADSEKALPPPPGSREGDSSSVTSASIPDDSSASTEVLRIPRFRIPVLPPTLTRFFGRESELVAITRALSGGDNSEATRLLTLTGLGGSGKTRLAIEVARQLADDCFEGAVWFVSLAEIDDLARIQTALQAVVAPEAYAASDLWGTLATAFGSSSLLVLDNLEHLLDIPVPNETLSVPAFLEELLRRFPLLTCLSTTRQRIGIIAEREFPVLPLPIPPAASPGDSRRKESPVMGGATTAAEHALSFASVALFADRARRAKFDFQVTERNVAAVTTLCTRLEGIPLGLELAAAWARVLKPAEMLVQFEEILVSRDNGLPARHRSLEAAIEGSYRMLDDNLRRFFRSLSVFHGGWTLEAARAVCASPAQTLSLLSDLCDRSLVLVEDLDESTRYRLLETVRTFAAARLAEHADEDAESRRSYISYFSALAAEANDGLQGADQAEWLKRISAEHQNLSAALEHMDRTTRLQTAGWLHRYWIVRGYLAEGRKWLSDALEEDGEVPVDVQNKAILVAGVLAWQAGDFAAAKPLYANHAARCQAIGDERGAAASTTNLGILAATQGDYAEAHAAYESAIIVWRRLNRPRSLASTYNNMGALALMQQDLEAARHCFLESLAWQEGDDDRQVRARTLLNLASVMNDLRDYPAAMFYASECLKIAIELSDGGTMTGLLIVLGEIQMNLGKHKEAARLFGARAAAAEYQPFDMSLKNKEMVSGYIRDLKTVMGEKEFEAAWQAGNSLSWQQMLTLIISTLP